MVLKEMVRVAKTQGKIGVVDVFTTSSTHSHLHNLLEKLRDDSHVKAFSLAELQEMVKEAGSQKAVAERLGITPAYLNDILRERTHVSENIANLLGFRWMLIPDDPALEEYLHRFVRAPEKR